MNRQHPDAVERVITGFHQDKNGDWVAELSCGHGLHMRHQPPWLLREWVLTEQGRRPFLGRMVTCQKCREGQRTGTASKG